MGERPEGWTQADEDDLQAFYAARGKGRRELLERRRRAADLPGSPTPAEPPDRCPACGCTEPCRDHGLARPAAPAGSEWEQLTDSWKVRDLARGIVGDLKRTIDAAVETALEEMRHLGPNWQDGMVEGWTGQWDTLTDDQRRQIERGFSGYVGKIGDVFRVMVREMHAQRAAREAAERASANWQEDARRHAANESHWRAKADEAHLALAASTEREAGLRALCEESLAAHSTVFDFGRHTNVTWKDALSKRDELRARLASLAAPEGGTDERT